VKQEEESRRGPSVFKVALLPPGAVEWLLLECREDEEGVAEDEEDDEPGGVVGRIDDWPDEEDKEEEGADEGEGLEGDTPEDRRDPDELRATWSPCIRLSNFF
jgi:hypothetical protein